VLKDFFNHVDGAGVGGEKNPQLFPDGKNHLAKGIAIPVLDAFYKLVEFGFVHVDDAL
jgi:hypothetical protein